MSPLSADRIASIATRPLRKAWGALNYKSTAQQLDFGFGIHVACCFFATCFFAFVLQKRNIYTTMELLELDFKFYTIHDKHGFMEKLRHLGWSKSSLPPFESQCNCLWNKLYEMVPETSMDYQIVGNQLDDETPWTLGNSWTSPFPSIWR